MLSAKDGVRYTKRVLRAMTGKDLIIFPDAACGKLCLGGEGGRWCVCPEGISEGSVIYSVGVGEDVSFDVALIEYFGVVVHAFDPTPKSVEWVKRATLPAGFIFHEIGLAHYDGDAEFSPPENCEHVSHRMMEAGRDGSVSIRRPVRKLKTIADELGHSKIDVLKIDIEGAEYEVISDLLESTIRPSQLLIEFHHRFSDVGLEPTKNAIKSLRESGYKILAVSPNGEEYTFIWMP